MKPPEDDDDEEDKYACHDPDDIPDKCPHCDSALDEYDCDDDCGDRWVCQEAPTYKICLKCGYDMCPQA